MLGVVNEDNWINKEFKKNKFKDKRLEKRFLKLVNSFSNMPSSSLAQQAEDWAEAKRAYRFFKNDNVYTSDFFLLIKIKLAKELLPTHLFWEFKIVQQ